MADESAPVSRPSKFVLLVGVPLTMLEHCVLGASPYPVMRADNPTTALAKIQALHPLIVIGGPEVAPSELENIRRDAVRFGATVLELTDDNVSSLGERLRAAVHQTNGSPP